MHIKLTNIMDMIASSSSGLGNSACHTLIQFGYKKVQKVLEFIANSTLLLKMGKINRNSAMALQLLC